MFDVSEDGSVDNIRTLISVRHPAWGQMAEILAGARRYEPRTVDGVPARREGMVMQYGYWSR